MRLVFFGYGELGAVVLEALVARHEVVLVVTHPTDFTGLGEPHVSALVDRHALPVFVSTHGEEPALAELVEQLRCDAVVSTNWRTRLPAVLLRSPRLGALNVHDALLPAYSGFGAVNWAIRNGETETGVTVHLMEEQLDTGPVVVAHRVPIGGDDTAREVYEAVTAQYVPATLAALAALADGDRGTPQDPARRSFYHRIGERDTRIDWRMSTTELYNLVRAQSDPYLNAWAMLGERRIFVKSAARPTGAYCGTPGRLIRPADGGVAVACGPTGAADSRGIILLNVQPEGERPVAASEYFKRMGGYLD